jgi:hypothetical protein
MGRLAGAAVLLAALSMLSFPRAVHADVVVQVDKSSQRMSVSVNGQHRYSWPISTGIYGTPSGTFRPQALSRNHHSSLYHKRADALLDLLRRQFRHPRHAPRLAARRSGLTRLRQAASLQCRDPVLAGAEGRPGQYQDFHSVGLILPVLRFSYQERPQRRTGFSATPNGLGDRSCAGGARAALMQ